MIADSRIESVRHDLAQCGQEHLLTFWDTLTAPERDHLVAQIGDLDLPRIGDWVETLVKNQPEAPITPRDFQPAKSYSPLPQTDTEREEYSQARRLGHELISAGKVAGFVVAGGQGTRLGFDGPKGNYPISPVRNKTLFQVFADRYERGSLLITSNLPFSEWQQVFQGERMTAALLDRLTHHCEILEMNGESYRFREPMKEKRAKSQAKDPSSGETAPKPRPAASKKGKSQPLPQQPRWA